MCAEQFFGTGNGLYKMKNNNFISRYIEKRIDKKKKRIFWDFLYNAEYIPYNDVDIDNSKKYKVV